MEEMDDLLPISQDTTAVDISSYTAVGRVGSQIVKGVSKGGDAGISDHFAEVVENELLDALKKVKDGADRAELLNRIGDVRAIRKLNNPIYPQWVRDMYDMAVSTDKVPAVQDNLNTNVLTSDSIAAKPMSDANGQHLNTLSLEGDFAPVILQQATRENNGVMKLKVPFYVGNSVSRTAAIKGKLFFGADKLPGLIQRVNAFIAEKKQPLTVYPRHAHALDASHLPVGIVSEVSQDGRVGYATIDIAPTSEGRDIQVLAERKMLNAVSLRSNEGQFMLQEVEVDGEQMFDVDMTLIAGIDFAPDGPAMPTYGIEVLAAEAHVVRNTHKEDSVGEEITLEAVKAKADIVTAIEKPLRDELAAKAAELQTVTQERDALKEKAEVAERESYIRDLAGRFPQPEEALKVIQDAVVGVKSKAEIDSKIMPLLLDALKTHKVTPEAPKPAVNPFLALFPSAGASGSGQMTQEKEVSNVGREVVSGLVVPE